MASFPFLLGAAFKAQSTRGIAETMETVAAGVTVAGGAVLGTAGTGEGDSGINIGFGKSITEKAFVTGSFTKDFANYVSRTVESFDITVPLKGNGETTTVTPVFGDFEPDEGIVALYRACGLTPVSGTGNSGDGRWEFVPAATDLLTAGVYIGGEGGDSGSRVVIRDVEAGSATFSFTPGEAANVQFALTGTFSELTSPATWNATPFTYGNQSTLSAPPVQQVGFTWLAREFGFESLQIVIDNQPEVIKASNVALGETSRQTGRTVTFTGKIDATDADIDYELTQLAASAIGSAQAMTFTVGTSATGGDEANAYTIEANDPELMSAKPVSLGGKQYWELTWVARATTANQEFSLYYE